MKLNRTELKKVLYDFNSVSNRLLRADFQDYSGVLSKFLAFINENDIIHKYIEDCGLPQYDMETEFNEVINSHGDFIFDLGKSNSDEVSNIYAILRHVVKNNYNIIYTIGRVYSRADKYQEVIKTFNERFVLILIRHIEGYLTKIGIEMGLDENVNYNITVTNGQVNVANDNATINALINNAIDQSELLRLINEVKKAKTSEFSTEEIESINGSLELIESELKQEYPRKSIVHAAMTALKAIKSTVEFSAATATLIQFISTVL